MSSAPTASIVIPTRDRPDYLQVALASVAPQAREAGAEVVVVDDGSEPGVAEIAAAYGARVIHPPSRGADPARRRVNAARGANAARNAGVAAAHGDPIVLLDDDVQAPAGWLRALLDGVASTPERDVFGGPIRAQLEGGGPRACGREPAPITTLDHGPEDCDVEFVWAANMAIRRRAFELVGPFDEWICGRGEEEDWERRFAEHGGRLRYLAGMGLDHRRTRADATVRSLAGAAYALGQTARRYDARKGAAPVITSECRTLAGCVWHVLRRRCAIGIVLGAHAAGRLREAVASRP